LSTEAARLIDQATVPHPLVIVGPFQPAAIAGLMPTSDAKQLEGLSNFAGVPVNWLAGALVHRGIRATLIGGVRGAHSRYIPSDPLSVAIYQSSGGWPFLLNGRSRERKEILARLQQIQPQLVHAHWTLEAGRAAADWKGPKVLTVHDAAWEYARLGWSPHPISMAYGTRWLANTGATLSRFQHLIAVSPFLESYLRLKHRFKGEIRVIPNAIPDLPHDLIAPQTFPKSRFITFACYGDRGKLKNIGKAIAAFHLLAQRLSDIRLIVFGDGWDEVKAELGASKRIEFMGSLPHRNFLKCLVEEVDIWVHPSRIETHGIVCCEALQAGCPVIAGRQSGAVPWTLDYGQSGLLVDVEDAGELAEAMYTLATNRGRATEMVRWGQLSIRERFNATHVLNLHLDYYKDLCSLPK